MKEWKEYHATHPVLYAFLSSEDAKIRKNAALILGETNESGAAKALFEAYQRENTRFVKSSYLTAMNGLDIETYQDAFGKRYKELLAEVPAESEKKHRTEELHALDKLLGGLNQNKKHRFTGYEEEVEVLLTTNPAYREITAEQIKRSPGAGSGRCKSKDNTSQGCDKDSYFPGDAVAIVRGHRIAAEPEAVAEAYAKSNLMELLNRLHEGNPPFRFRMEVRALHRKKKAALSGKRQQH